MHEHVALAQKLVSRDPRVARLLDGLGLMNHPRIIERAQAERARGRLK
jgi:hypothetical protein